MFLNIDLRIVLACWQMLPVKKGALQTNRPQVAYKGLTGRCVLSAVGGEKAGRWTTGCQEGLVGRWMCHWQMDVGRWHQLADGCPVLECRRDR